MGVEEFAYRAVELREIEIDADGTIWRVAARRADRWNPGATVSIPCARRRTEHWTGKYLCVRVMIDGRRVTALAHRLVWRHFKGAIPDGLTINHKDGVTRNNAPDNLELATMSEQRLHSIHVLGHNTAENLGPWLNRSGASK